MVQWVEEYRLGYTVMDNIHEEFIELLNDALDAEGSAFDVAFLGLMQHTIEHFAFEELKMEEVNLSSRIEHMDEHKRILGELDFFYSKAISGRRSFARAYLKEHLPHWLRQHTATMDADLAAKLSGQY